MCVCVYASLAGGDSGQKYSSSLPQLMGEILLSLRWKRPRTAGLHASQAPSGIPRPCGPGDGVGVQGKACAGPKGLRAESDFPFGSPLWGCCCGGDDAGAWETSEEERRAQARQWMGGGGRREGHLGPA